MTAFANVAVVMVVDELEAFLVHVEVAPEEELKLRMNEKLAEKIFVNLMEL